jgi:hypothetical protein
MMPDCFKFGDLHEMEYILARLKLDLLCESIRQHRVTAIQAKDEYTGIENRYLLSNEEKADLFRMIYKSRIERLCEQFLAEGA